MTTVLKRQVKTTALRALRSAGVYSLAANSAWRRQRLLILCYHGISLVDEHEWAGYLFITAERFRQRLQQLRDLNANVLPLGEALSLLRRGALPPRAVVITFDDGFYDLLKLAVPLLNAFQFPATVYLTTHYSGLRMPVINLVLDYILWKSHQQAIAFPEQGVPDPLPTHHWTVRAEVVQRLLGWCNQQNLTTTQKDEFAQKLARRFEIDYDSILRSRMLQIMTPEEVFAAHRAGIDIQLHTHRHRTPLDRSLFVSEIQENRERIREITGKSATHFCYPSGRYHEQFFPWLHECGVESATTCVRGFARPEFEPYLIPRVLDDSNMPPVEFEGVASGLFA